uniref:Uncharacterized protein n=1 Tax=Sphaerodactylus townsendi TaxID=933632 RepID=A0ACB8GB47_9SAUR
MHWRNQSSRSGRAKPSASIITPGITVIEPEAAETTTAPSGPDCGGGALRGAPVTLDEAARPSFLDESASRVPVSAQPVDDEGDRDQEVVSQPSIYLQPVSQCMASFVEIQQQRGCSPGNQLILNGKPLVGCSTIVT